MLVYPAAPDRPAAEELWTAPVHRNVTALGVRLLDRRD